MKSKVVAMRNKAIESLRVGWRATWSSVVMLGLVGVSACNEHPVGDGPAPEFRAITVPLPPPSFRSAPLVNVRLQGQAPSFAGGRAMAWELENPRGIAGPVALDGSFVLPEWELNPANHCIELRAQRGVEPVSAARYFALVLANGPACAAPNCSQGDAQGECVCIQRFAAGCVDKPEWQGSGDSTQGVPDASAAGSSTGSADMTGL